MHGHFEHLSETDIAWIAGLLEGEGSFMKPAKNDPYGMPRIQIQMTDHDVIEKIAKMFGVVAYKVKNPRYEQNGWKTPYMAFIRGSRAAEMMNIVKPYMGTRRQSQIDSALESYQKPKHHKLNGFDVSAIRQELSKGEDSKTICDKYNITRFHLSRIRTGKIWKSK